MSVRSRWGKPPNADKWHIFEDGRTLCDGGDWLYFDADAAADETDSYRGGEDCKACCLEAGILVADG